MSEIIIVLTLATFLLLAGMTLECVWRFGYWSAWAVFTWCLTAGFAWLLVADVAARVLDYVQLAEAPIRNGVFRALVCAGAAQWMCRQGGKTHG